MTPEIGQRVRFIEPVGHVDESSYIPAGTEATIVALVPVGEEGAGDPGEASAVLLLEGQRHWSYPVAGFGFLFEEVVP